MFKRFFSVSIVFILLFVTLFTIGLSTNVSAASGVTFYQNADYTGTAVTLGVGTYTMSQMNAAGIPNDWLSSLRVPNNYTVELYQNDNFTGTKWTFTADSNYVGSACNDQTTSIKILAAVFYRDADYGGTSEALGPGSYTMTQMNAAGIPNDWVSSLKVPSGWTVEIYQNDNFTGTKWTFTFDTSYVGSACNDQMTSVKILNQSAPSSNSIYSVPASSIPAPTGSGTMSFRVMNGTNGAYSDSQIYWAVLGKNPTTDKWCYLDLNGNLVPISNALNDASGHLTKNGANYANIYYTISQKQWVSIPEIKSGRLFLSVGSPCYIKTYDDGFAGPDINNPTDPNKDVYFDFVEFTIDNKGYHGNTTRVDMFGFPIQHRLVNKAGNYDRTVGEYESETRAGLFIKYQNEVPSQFKDLATVQAPYRIIAPIHGSFKAGGANANYFSSYSSISTQDILMGVGGAANPATCAALNRHVYHLSNWNNVADYYNAAPANYYARFWHVHSIGSLAYGFCYDDVNEQSALLEVGDPKGLIVRIGW